MQRRCCHSCELSIQIVSVITVEVQQTGLQGGALWRRDTVGMNTSRSLAARQELMTDIHLDAGRHEVVIRRSVQGRRLNLLLPRSGSHWVDCWQSKEDEQQLKSICLEKRVLVTHDHALACTEGYYTSNPMLPSTKSTDMILNKSEEHSAWYCRL